MKKIRLRDLKKMQQTIGGLDNLGESKVKKRSENVHTHDRDYGGPGTVWKDKGGISTGESDKPAAPAEPIKK